MKRLLLILALAGHAAAQVTLGSGVTVKGAAMRTTTALIVANTTPTSGEPTSAITMTFGGYSLPVYLAAGQAVIPSPTNTSLGTSNWAQVSWDGSFTTVAIGYTSTVTSATVQTIQGGTPVNITPAISGSTIAFPYSGTGQVKIEVNGNYMNPIYLLANPLEINPPSPTGTNVQQITPGTYASTISLTGSNTIMYFGPGVYNANAAVPIQHLGSGKQIYLADGAFVYGSGAVIGLNQLVSGTGSNITVNGRGVLDMSLAPGNAYITALSISGTTATATTGVGSLSIGNTFVGGESFEFTGTASACPGLTGNTYTVATSPAPTSSSFTFTQSVCSSGSGSGYTGVQAQPDAGLRPNIISLTGTGAANGFVVDGIILRDSPGITAQLINVAGFTYNNVKEFGWRVNSDGIDVDGSNGTITNCLFRVYDDAISPKSLATGQQITSLTASNNFIWVGKATAFKVGTESVDNMSGITLTGARIASYNTQNYPLLAVPIYDQGTTTNVTVSNISIDVLNQALYQAGVVFGIPQWSNGLGNGNPGLLSNVTFSAISSPSIPQTPGISLTGYSSGNPASNIQFLNDLINGSALLSSQVTASSYVTFTVTP